MEPKLFLTHSSLWNVMPMTAGPPWSHSMWSYIINRSFLGPIRASNQSWSMLLHCWVFITFVNRLLLGLVQMSVVVISLLCFRWWEKKDFGAQKGQNEMRINLFLKDQKLSIFLLEKWPSNEMKQFLVNVKSQHFLPMAFSRLQDNRYDTNRFHN